MDDLMVKVERIEEILKSNGISVNAGFSAKYLGGRGFPCDRGRKAAEKCVNAMFALAKDVVNGGYSNKRKNDLQDLAEYTVKLSGYDNTKLKKIEQIEKNVEEIDMSKQSSDVTVDLNRVLGYVKETKKALQILADPKFGLSKYLPNEAMIRVSEVLTKLGELENSLSDGNIVDLTSKQALDMAKSICEKVYRARVNIDNSNITVETLRVVGEAIENANGWKLLTEAPKRKDRLDKNDDVTLHQDTQCDADIVALAAGEETLEKFAIFEALLNDKENRRQVIQQNIDDIDKRLDDVNAKLSDLTEQQRDAYEQYQNDGDEVKLNRVAERLERDEKRLNETYDRLNEQKSRLYEKMDSDEDTEYMIRKSIYDPVMAFEDAYSLFITAAAQIPYDTINGIFFRGVSGEEELDVFRKTILTLSNQHESVLRNKKKAINSVQDIENVVDNKRQRELAEDEKLRKKMREMDRGNALGQAEEPKKQTAADRIKDKFAKLGTENKQQVKSEIPPERLRISNDDK